MPENNNQQVGKIEKPVVTGKVTVNKKSNGQKFIDSIGEDARSIGDYVAKDILIPTFKDMLWSIVTNSLEMLIYPDSEDRPSHNRGKKKGYVSYNKMYDRNPRNRVPERHTAKPKNRYSVEELEFETRSDADEVLSILEDHIREYDQVSVGDYYQACDVTPEWSDYNYGWYSLSNARVERSRGAWIIIFPKAVSLND